MVIDSSAVLAILLNEVDRPQFVEAITKAPVRLMSVLNALEAAIVIEARKGPIGGRELDLFVHRAGIELVPVDRPQLEQARRIWRTYGKGNHPAGLNLADCCAMGLARVSGHALLFKGDDFARTDVRSALPVRGPN